MQLLKLFWIALLVFTVPRLNAQSTAQKAVDQYRDSLNILAKRMQRGENDSVRFASASVFNSIVGYLLSDSASFSASFDSIPNISVKNAPDNAFRLYTWMAANYEGSSYTYFGYLQNRNARTKTITLTALHDSTVVIAEPLTAKLCPEKWYGASYYSVLLHTHAGKKIYTLLGWKGKNEMLTQKVIDVLSFTNGKASFGLPVFQTKKNLYARVLFEFTSQSTMLLRYEKAKNLIVFDHIGRSAITGIIGPEGSYDAFHFEKEKWQLLEDVDVDNGFVPKKKEVKLLKDEDLQQRKEEK